MKTSYFAKAKYVQVPVSITAGPVRFFNGPRYEPLGPPPHLVKLYKENEITVDEYTKIYYELVLDKINPHETYQDIVNKFGEECTLLCYESPEKFCHRHLVSEWFRQHGYNVIEEKFTKRENWYVT